MAEKIPYSDEKFPIELTQMTNIINLSKNAQIMCELNILLYLLICSVRASFSANRRTVNSNFQPFLFP